MACIRSPHHIKDLTSLPFLIETMEAFVLARCQQSEQYVLITTTQGIGKILGMAILLETGPIERFAQVGELLVLCALCAHG